MKPPAVVEKLDGQQWLDKPAKAVESTLSAAIHKAGDAGEKAMHALHGEWMGHPLHPALTDLPVGAFTLASLLDCTPADQAADAAIVVGLLGSAPTALAGWSDWYATKDQRVKRTGLVHAVANISMISLYGASLVARKKGNRRLGKALGWIGLATLTLGAYLGGHMVYNLGAGVDQ
ncbi:MAG: hypothetical protein QOJ65_2369 [Fimbriimonadaceae bacterium]|jgi:uncharacterized membrane protein|nr:hypothetical protein [Fimbriimonadaceae bacterium]